MRCNCLASQKALPLILDSLLSGVDDSPLVCNDLRFARSGLSKTPKESTRALALRSLKTRPLRPW